MPHLVEEWSPSSGRSSADPLSTTRSTGQEVLLKYLFFMSNKTDNEECNGRSIVANQESVSVSEICPGSGSVKRFYRSASNLKKYTVWYYVMFAVDAETRKYSVFFFRYTIYLCCRLDTDTIDTSHFFSSLKYLSKTVAADIAARYPFRIHCIFKKQN